MNAFEFNDVSPQHGQVRVFALMGELDRYSTSEFRATLDGVMAAAPGTIVLDCGGLAYVDSAGLGALVGALKRMSDLQRALVLARPGDPVRRVLAVTGLDRLFTIYDSVDAACAACGGAA